MQGSWSTGSVGCWGEEASGPVGAGPGRGAAEPESASRESFRALPPDVTSSSAIRLWVRLFFVGGPEGFCERHGKSYLTRRMRGEEGDGGGSVTGRAIPSMYGWAWFRWYSRASWKSQYASKSRLARSARSFRDCLGANQAPASAGQLHRVADQVPARPFDDSGGDGIAHREAAVVVQIRRVLLRVVGARIDRLACVGDCAVRC